MADRTGDTVELLQQLIRNACVNDGTAESGHEDRSAAVLASHLEDVVDLQCYEPTPGRRSLVARIEGSDPTAPSLCLMGHTDVVPVTPEGWSRDPFGGELVGGEVWGRGAVDMLNMTASMAVAFRDLAASGFRPRGTLIYLAVADEEARAAHGAEWLVDHAWDAVGADYVVTESGGWHLHSAAGHHVAITSGEKGTQARRLRVRGTPGHGSMPLTADNALLKAAEVVRRVAAIRPRSYLSEQWTAYVAGLDVTPEVRSALLDPDRVWDAARALPTGAGVAHAMTHTTFAPTVIHGGVKTNVIPDAVDVEVDIRIVPSETGDDVDRYLVSALGELAGDVSIERVWDLPASSSPTDTPLWDLLTRITQRAHPGAVVMPRLTPGGTDLTFYRAAGAVGYGFAVMSAQVDHREFASRFHGSDERIDVESLRLTTEAWGILAREFCG